MKSSAAPRARTIFERRLQPNAPRQRGRSGARTSLETRDLRPHVLHIERLDCVPIEPQLHGDVADRGLSAATPDIEGEALGEVRIVRQKIQPLAFHRGASPALDAPHLQIQNDPKSGARQIANPPPPTIEPARLDATAATANRFFERRSSVTIRTSGSPKTPLTVSSARKPANEYPSDSRRCRFPDFAIPHDAEFQRQSKP